MLLYKYSNKYLCKYKNIFGKPGIGIHKYKIFNIAIFDFIGTIMLSLIIHNYFNLKINIILFTILLFILSIIIHKIFCVKTTLSSII